MALDTLPSFSAAPPAFPWEPKFFVRYPFQGVEYCVGFDSFDDVLNAVTSKKDHYGEYLPTDVVNLIVDFAEESLEWNARPPVAEAVTDEPCGDQQLAEIRSDLRSQGRLVVWGVVAAVVIGLLF